jgi:PIN domain nuclease of toxin-antitoxin system
VILLDTHALVWLAEDDPQLGPKATQLAENALRADELLISAMSFWEIAMLAAKNRAQLSRSAEDIRRQVLAQGFREIPVDGEIGVSAVRLSNFHGDPADRSIAATAETTGATLLTADRRILGWRGRLKTHDARR